jgi:hypothetical protein
MHSSHPSTPLSLTCCVMRFVFRRVRGRTPLHGKEVTNEGADEDVCRPRGLACVTLRQAQGDLLCDAICIPAGSRTDPPYHSTSSG